MRLPCRSRVLVLVLLVAAAAACAPRTAPLPPAPVTPKFPEFVYPPPPASVEPALSTAQLRGWRLLQSGNVRGAEREFSLLLRRRPGFVPAEAALGYTALGRRDPQAALRHFDAALARADAYAPALVGRAQALLALGRDDDALASYEAAAAADPGLDLGARIAVLRFRGVRDSVTTAREAAASGDVEAARAAYEQAIAASPESAFLHRELAAVEQKAGRTENAVVHLRKATELDPGDARSHAMIGDLEAQEGDYAAAIASYQASLAIEPSAEVSARLAEVRRNAEIAALPREYEAIASAAQATRGDLAAVLGVRLADWVRAARAREAVLVTDTRGHWAAPWILPVLQAGLMEVYPNHTFQPRAVLRRGELAQSVARMLNVIAARRPGTGATWRAARPAMADLPASHPSYRPAALAVAAGVLPLLPGDTFQPGRPVSGPELTAAIERLRRLAGTLPAARPY